MPAKILIVEDEVAIRDMYRAKFSLEGFEVSVATDGKDGFQMAKKLKPSLVLLDLRMPHVSGDEMLARLRATDWGADMRVIILTNLSRAEAPSSLRYLAVDRYIVKAHHTPAQVVSIVREVLHIPQKT